MYDVKPNEIQRGFGPPQVAFRGGRMTPAESAIPENSPAGGPILEMPCSPSIILDGLRSQNTVKG